MIPAYFFLLTYLFTYFFVCLSFKSHIFGSIFHLISACLYCLLVHLLFRLFSFSRVSSSISYILLTYSPTFLFVHSLKLLIYGSIFYLLTCLLIYSCLFIYPFCYVLSSLLFHTSPSSAHTSYLLCLHILLLSDSFLLCTLIHRPGRPSLRYHVPILSPCLASSSSQIPFPF